ncbi:VWA domain-containing protein [bacterium]|nr:VWA domain-containing protein [bacterium]
MMFRCRSQQNGLATVRPLNPGLRYAFIISLAIHIIAMMITAVFFLKRRYESEDFIYVDFIQTAMPVKFRRAKLRAQQRFALPKDIQLSSETRMPNLVPLEKLTIVDEPLSPKNITLFSDAMVRPDINSIGSNVSTSGLIQSGGNSTSGTAFTTKLLKNRTLISSAKIDRSTEPIIPEIYKSINLMSNINALPQPDLPLEKIAKHLLTSKQKDKLDIVFIVDASQSMGNNIDTVINHLGKMINIFQSGGLDFTIGVVTFRYGTLYSMLGWDIRVLSQTTDIKKVKQELGSIRCRGDEKALNALMQAIAKVKFRKDAERHFILVTDEYVSGSYSAAEVFEQIQKFDIKVDVIGVDEPFQRMIAQRTGGLWFLISKIDG